MPSLGEAELAAFWTWLDPFQIADDARDLLEAQRKHARLAKMKTRGERNQRLMAGYERQIARYRGRLEKRGVDPDHADLAELGRLPMPTAAEQLAHMCADLAGSEHLDGSVTVDQHRAAEPGSAKSETEWAVLDDDGRVIMCADEQSAAPINRRTAAW